MVSVSAVRKKIKDYIATDSSQFVQTGDDNGFDGQYVGYRIGTTANSGDAKIEGLDLRLQTVFRGKFLVAQSTNPALVQWQVPKWTWSWKSRYNFSKGLGVFLDVELSLIHI